MSIANDHAEPADTRVMGIVHSALRRDLRRARSTLSTWPYPFDAQRVAIADHLGWMMRFLHHHHESEDDHLYPLVRERNADAGRLLDQMDADHRAILPAMSTVETAALAYRASATAREQMVAALDELLDTLLPHLEREEREMMPMVSATISDAEWRRWDNDYNVKPLGAMELADQGLFILDGLEGDDRAAITQLVPAVPRWIILNVMIRRYRRQAFNRWRTTEFSPLKATLRGRQEVTTGASPQQVWDILADVTRVGEWSHECHAAQWLDGATAAVVGAKFSGASESGRAHWQRSCTFVALDEPHEMVWITDGGIYGDNTEWRYRLEPTADGTRIVQTFRVLAMPVWFDRLVWRLTPAHHDRRAALHSDLTRLARLAEST